MMMKNKIMPAVVKGVVIGAIIGAGAACAAGIDMSCECRSMKKKAGYAYKCMCRSAGRAMHRAADRLESVR